MENKNLLYISFEGSNERSDAQSMHTRNLAEAFAPHVGNVTLVLTGKPETEERGNYRQVGVAAPHLAGGMLGKALGLVKKNIAMYRAAMKYGREADVIYERQNPGSFIGLLVAKRLKKPLYYEVNSLNAEEAMLVHGVTFKPVISFFRGLMQYQLNNAKRVFVQTRELQEILQSNYKAPQTIVVPNGAHVPESYPLKVERQPGQPLEVVYVGTVDGYHALSDILETVSGLEGKVNFTAIGTGPTLNELREQYKKVPNVHFTGSLPHHEIPGRLAKADVGIAHYNTGSELFKKFGFYFCPLKLIEYSAQGMPSVIIGASNSFVKQFEDAGVCQVVDDADALSGILVDYYEHPEKVADLSRKAYETAKPLSWDAIAQRTLQEF